jgi:glycosyltransferase involved in cell wall biosynthesis
MLSLGVLLPLDKRSWGINLKLGFVTCSKADFQGLMQTIESYKYFQKHITEIVLVLSDFSENEIRLISKSTVDLPCRFIVSDSMGIYNAMNLGVKEISTDYVVFLNGGDELVQGDGLLELFDGIKGYEWGYGALQVINLPGAKTKIYRSKKYCLLKHRFGIKYVPHPSTMFRRLSIIDRNGFDESFSVAADQEMILRFAIETDPYVVLKPISRFYTGGLSARNDLEIVQDFHKISLKLFGAVFNSELIDTFLWTMNLHTRVFLRAIIRRFKSRY